MGVLQAAAAMCALPAPRPRPRPRPCDMFFETIERKWLIIEALEVAVGGPARSVALKVWREGVWRRQQSQQNKHTK